MLGNGLVMHVQEWNRMAMDTRRELAWCFVMAKWGCVSKSSDLQRYGYEMISKVMICLYGGAKAEQRGVLFGTTNDE